MKVKWIISYFIFFLLTNSYAQNKTIQYEYDNLNRLTRIDYGDGTIIEYTYDAVGNRTSHIIAVNQENPVLIISPTSWTAPSSGGTSPAIEVTNSGGGGSINYTISENEDWLSLSETSGTTPGSFTITATENNTGSTRTGEVAVESSGVSGSPQTVTVTQSNIEVPVELSLFTAEAKESSIILKWRTETEMNNYGFNIYRSLEDSSGYQKINRDVIPGAGNSNEAHEYFFLDKQVAYNKTYYYKLEDINLEGTKTLHDAISVKSAPRPFPKSYALLPGYPNPFNPELKIEYHLPAESHVEISVYNLLGQELVKLVDQEKGAGYYLTVWNGSDKKGITLGSGVYIIHMTADNFMQQQKVTILR